MRMIYGMGKRGMYLYFLLKDYGIDIDGFIDKNNNKIGTIAEGVACYGLHDIIYFECPMEIIISPKKSDGISRLIRQTCPAACIIEWSTIIRDYPMKVQVERDVERIISMYESIKGRPYESDRNK